jgi:hypothetical protein
LKRKRKKKFELITVDAVMQMYLNVVLHFQYKMEKTIHTFALKEETLTVLVLMATEDPLKYTQSYLP